MPRPSNPTARTLRLLDLLASRPRDSFGLSDLARSLRMNKSTCRTILATLTAAGYVLVDPSTRRYGLGPGSVALGAAALRRFPAIQRIGGEMQRLSDELDLSVTAVALAAEQLIVVANHAPSVPMWPITRVGIRSPYAPPLGLEFAAWADPPSFDRWLRKSDPPLSDREVATQRQAIAFVRSYGYAVGLKTSVARDALDGLPPHPSLDALRARDALVPAIMAQLRGLGETYVLTAVQGSRNYPVLTITAPVFEPDGNPCLSVVVSGFRGDLSGRALQAIAGRIVERTQQISVLLGARSKRYRRLQPT